MPDIYTQEEVDEIRNQFVTSEHKLNVNQYIQN